VRPYHIISYYILDTVLCNNTRANISIKTLRPRLRFRDVLPNFRLVLYFLIAGAFSAVTCSENSLVLFERIFCVPLKIYHGFSFCFLWFISFLFLSQKKKRKKRTNKKES